MPPRFSCVLQSLFLGWTKFTAGASDALNAGIRQLEDRLLACIKAAYCDAAACMVQFRKSGEPFITHPVEVTRILAELKMDPESLIAGLLHDTVEDTENVKFEEIEVMQLSCLLIMHPSPTGNSNARWIEGSVEPSLVDTVFPGFLMHCRALVLRLA